MNPVMGYVLYKLMVINIRTMKDFKYLISVLWLIPMLYIPVTINSTFETDYYRKNLVDNANQVAEYIFVMLCLYSYCLHSKSKIRSIFTIFYVGLCILCIYLTGSRTLLVSLPFITILYLLIYDKANSIRKPFIIIIGSLSIFSSYQLILPQFLIQNLFQEY